MKVVGQRHAPAALSQGKRPFTHCVGGRVGPRAGLGGCGKYRPQLNSIPDRPASSESLYRLSHWNTLNAIHCTLRKDGHYVTGRRYLRPFPTLCNVLICCCLYTGLFISPSGNSELDCATTKTDTAERDISISRESLKVLFVLGALAYLQVPPLGGSRDEKWRA